MKICIIGAGAVGGSVAGYLVRAGADVQLVARGSHLAALRERGLTVEAPAGSTTMAVRATDRLSDVSGSDLVLLCTKTYDNAALAPQLGAMLSARGVVLTLQNGIDPRETLRGHVDPARIVAGVPFVLAELGGPGVVRQSSPRVRIVFGQLERGMAELAAIHGVLQGAGLDAEMSDDIRGVLWRKFVPSAAGNGVSAALRVPLGELAGSPQAREMFVAAGLEIVAVAAAEGVDIPRKFVDDAAAGLANLPKHADCAMHRDVIHGRPLELAALNGKVVALGARHGVPTPVNAEIVARLRPYEMPPN